ncbi:MAG: HD domain-containing protein [Candidatus Omnitrophota bacterium]|nr:HD domain-containing protein [Candidatus Omnitrophota bacterium]
MRLGYRKNLEKAARQTILIHRPNTLIKLILRTIVVTTKVSHAGILIYDKKKDAYVVKVSKGFAGIKIPSGFVKVEKANPLIRYFTDKNLYFPEEIIIFDKIEKILRSSQMSKNISMKNFFQELKANLSLFQAKACIPGFFRNELVGVLFLGEKRNKKKFSEEELGFLSVLASDVVMALKNAWLIEDLNQQLETNKRLLLQTISALSSSIEAKDKYTIGHTERVAKYSLAIAQSLRKAAKITNWEKFLDNLRIAALLHDIGKIGIPESILHKDVGLDDEERKIMENHSLIGANILNNIEEFKEALLGVKYHHEKYDGSGYPFHLKGKQIPLIASIISLADTFDAMVTDRPYRKGISIEDALREIKKNRGKQFAPYAVDAFLKIYSLPKVAGRPLEL